MFFVFVDFYRPLINRTDVVALLRGLMSRGAAAPDEERRLIRLEAVVNMANLTAKKIVDFMKNVTKLFH